MLPIRGGNVMNKDLEQKNSDLNQQIKEFDEKLKGLERENKINYDVSKTQDAISTIRECVSQVLEIENLKTSREENPKEHDNRMLTIVSWFNYLKKESQDTKEYEEAKDLILSIAKKHPEIAEWCENLINKPLQ